MKTIPVLEVKSLMLVAFSALVVATLLIACETGSPPSPAQAPTATIEPVPTDTVTPVPTRPAPADTPTSTPAPVYPDTPTTIPTDTPTAPPDTVTSTPLPTDTPIPTSTNTATPTETAISTPTATETPIPRPIQPPPTATIPPTPYPTNTPSPTPTDVPESTAPTPTTVPTATPEIAPTDTPQPVATDTPVPEPTTQPIPSPTETPIPVATYTPTPTATTAAISGNDRDALATVYDALDGTYWNDNRNWVTDAPISEWKGVYTDHSGKVVILDLEFNALSGEIPQEIGSLSELQELLIGGNDLRGNIPEELGRLSQLVVLDISGNGLSGMIPQVMGNLTNLMSVQVSGNQLAGCLPDGWRNIQDNDFEATNLPFCGDSSGMTQPETSTPTPEPATPNEPTPTPTPLSSDPPEPTPTPTATPAPEPTATPTPTPTPSPDTVIANAFSRFNQQRQNLGLSALKTPKPGDSDLITVDQFVAGCSDPVEQHEQLLLKTLHGIRMTISDAGSECGLNVTTYHIVPESEKMRVEKNIWDCFAQAADINTPGDVSCGGRFEAYGKHVKWHPDEIFFFTESQVMRSGIQALTSWVKEKTNVKVSEVQSKSAANLVLYLGDRVTQECPGRAGCSYARQGFGDEASEIFIFEQGIYFSQVFKHELLHIILPMGHLPAGNTLMTVSPTDPSQTNNLTSKEEKLLKLYLDPYLRDGMTMDEYKQYLVIE